MADVPPARISHRRPVVDAAGAAAGMCLFALLVHSEWPWNLASAAGLILAADAVWHSFQTEGAPGIAIGLSPLCRKVALWLVPGCLLGMALGVLFRVVSGTGALPAGVGQFVLVAAAIGAVEELVFRGFVQGRLRQLGWPAAVVLAAAAHTAYKSALFAAPPAGVEIDHVFLAVWTLIGGVAFGLLRQGSGSVLPPVAAHVAFDVVVYGELAQAPWWVWS